MKKMKVLLVGILTLIMSFMCFSGCAIFKAGKYEATSLEVAGFSKELDAENPPYVELKLDGTAVVSIKADTLSYNGDYTWEEGDGTIKIMKDGKEVFELTEEDGGLVLNLLSVKLIFEK